MALSLPSNMDLQKLRTFFVACKNSPHSKPIVGSLIVVLLIGILYISIARPVQHKATAHNATKSRYIQTRLPGSRLGPIVKAQDSTNRSAALGDSIPKMDRTSKTSSFSKQVYSMMWKGAVPINEKDANVKVKAPTNGSSALGDRFYRSQEARWLRFG